MMIPTIHLNGTSRDNLIDGICEIDNALRKALAAMESNGPNARDYYPQGPKAFTKARAEHAARCAKVQALREEYEQMLNAVAL